MESNKKYWSIDDLFQDFRNFYEDSSKDEFIRDLRLDEMKLLLIDVRFDPEYLGWFALFIHQMRGDLLKQKEVMEIAKLSIKHSSIRN